MDLPPVIQQLINEYLSKDDLTVQRGLEPPRGFLAYYVSITDIDALNRWIKANGPTNLLIGYAIKMNNQSVFSWACAQKMPLTDACTVAAHWGKLDMLKQLRALVPPAPWNSWTCAYAIDEGHFDILVWLRENGCPWDEWSAAYAAANGRTDILTWMRSQDPPCPWDENTPEYARQMEFVELAEWAIEQGCAEF